MEGIAEADPFGNLFHEGARLAEPFGGEVHFEAEEKLVGALVIVPLEQPAQIGAVNVALLRDLLERFEPLKMLLNMLLALLVGGEGEGFDVFERPA